MRLPIVDDTCCESLPDGAVDKRSAPCHDMAPRCSAPGFETTSPGYVAKVNSNATTAGLGIGVALGVTWWLVLDNVAFLAAGIAVGMAIGAGIDRQRGDDEGES